MTISIKILESTNIIRRKILESIVEDMNKLFSQSLKSIDNKLKSLTREFIKSTITYASLDGGVLAAHFGLPQGGEKARIDSIISTINNNIEVKFDGFKRAGNSISGGVNIGILLSSFADILNLPEAVVTTERGQQLPWLQWLLLEGNRIIITDYEIRLKVGKGRSGGGIMVREEAGIWRVPPEYAGTDVNNWLTNSLSSNITQYQSRITKFLETEANRIF